MKLRSALFFAAVPLATALLLSLFIRPQCEGDGHQYFLMAEGLWNRMGFSLKSADIESAERLLAGNPHFSCLRELRKSPPGNYTKASSGELYASHFWLYSLLSLLFRFILKILQMDQIQSFVFMSLFCLLCSLIFLFWCAGLR